MHAHGVQMQEEVAEDERRAAAVGVRRAAAHQARLRSCCGTSRRFCRKRRIAGVARRRLRWRSSCDLLRAGGNRLGLRRRDRCPAPTRVTASHGSAFGAGPFDHRAVGREARAVAGTVEAVGLGLHEAAEVRADARDREDALGVAEDRHRAARRQEGFARRPSVSGSATLNLRDGTGTTAARGRRMRAERARTAARRAPTTAPPGRGSRAAAAARVRGASGSPRRRLRALSSCFTPACRA